MASALSLRCADCGAQLRSVKECQDHGEATGHSNFEESEEAVLNMVCEECGKPCRSQVEQELHAKRTGHAKFVDRTGEAAAPLNTEAQMKQAAADIKAEAMDAEGPGAASGSGGGEGGGPAEEQVEPEVDPALLTELMTMGFSRNKCVRALFATGTTSAETAANWVMEHEGDADLDEPLLVPKSKARKLTPEEAKAKAAEMVKAAKAKREAIEREAEREREKRRVRAGKELAAAQRLEDDLKVKRALEERLREKAEAAKAKERIRQKLDEDRRARRRKLGLPEELSEAEQEAERRKIAEKEAEEARRKLPVKPVSAAEKLRAALVAIKKAAPAGQDERVSTCYATMLKLVANVARSPGEEKFRRVKLTNPAIQAKIASLEGAVAFLQQLGFKPDASGEYLEMPADGVDAELLNVAGGELNNALTNPFFGKL